MLLALGQRDLEALTERIQRIVHPGEALLRHGQGVDPLAVRQGAPAHRTQLVVDEVAVEPGVVGDQRRVADELQELVADLLEARLVPEELDGDAVHGLGLGLDVALGVDVAVEAGAGGNEVLELQARQLDQPVAGTRIKAGGLGVEDDLAGHDD